jgi:hypothetical protein
MKPRREFLPVNEAEAEKVIIPVFWEKITLTKRK